MSSLSAKQQIFAAAMLVAVALGPALSAAAQFESRRDRTRPTSFGFSGERRIVSPTMTSRSRHPVVHQESITPLEGEIILNDPAPVIADTHGCQSCGTEVACGVDWNGYCDDCMIDDCGDCGACGGCAARGCLLPCPQISVRNMEFFAGTQGFKGQPNFGQDGSFGVNYGLNWGFHLPCFYNDAFAGQFGLRSLHSNFENGPLTANPRDQVFGTAGIFRRVDYGLQGGVVADILYEDWYGELEVAQLRGSLSWLYSGGDELGFWFTSSIQDETDQVVIGGAPQILNVRPLSQYRFFYTHQFDPCCNGGHATLSGGLSEDGDIIVGSDFWFPLADRWAFTSGVTYLAPDDATAPNGNINESWNLGLGLVWYPMGIGPYKQRYTSPMFNVADNGSFLIAN